ncbi:hypothetical protein HOC37_07115 [bacterium]|jgi:hypothetical protein|nr:hypothetical protein [bacterium]MBT3582020.1 hypothetical protein [bacterium]MBT4552728.1 hypothetical protein [bacterium]MBT5988105.1 hypothetical protein [bacterium]MBT7087355.1 hypothetical protein [bacterium]
MWEFINENWMLLIVVIVLLPIIVVNFLKDLREIRRSRQEIKMMDRMLKDSEKRIQILGQEIVRNNKNFEESLRSLDKTLKGLGSKNEQK